MSFVNVDETMISAHSAALSGFTGHIPSSSEKRAVLIFIMVLNSALPSL